MHNPSKTQRSWCAMLAKLTCPMDAQTACAAFIDMLPMLPGDDEAYNRSTLENAARREQGDTAIPNYDRLVRAFSEWRRQSLPAHVRMGGTFGAPAISAPSYEPSAAECERVDNLVTSLKEDLAKHELEHGKIKVEPRYCSILELALSAAPSVLASRPDYRRALEMHQQAEGVRA